MASSSQVSRTKYDVFISFRGEDVRFGFLSYLKKELRQKQIDAFVDDKLERGDEISLALLTAIEESLISLIIFSKDYASSKWCLEELAKIVECMDRNKQIVIPVFYNTDPSDVRHQKGSYGDAVAKLEKNYKEKVQIWRSSLYKAANLSGFHSSNFGDEAELVEQIAKSLSTRLNMMYPCELRNLVGIDKKITELESLMRQGFEDVCVIGIWGMGGIGKTTIAAAVFNRFCFEYEGCCFLANVREESLKHGIIYLKNKIFSMLLKENDLHIGTPNAIPSYVERKLLRKKILLVLDDINDLDQLENLVGASNYFGPGSRIIITTRDKEVLDRKVDKIYEVKPLIIYEALELFNSHAFKENCQDMEWIELSRRVIEYTKGLPLALKVLSSLLYGKSKEEWKSQLKKLEKMPCKKIHDVLRLSFDSLDRQQKNIFLYIACVFKGYQHCQIIVLLDACGFSTAIELKVLQDKALIFWDAKNSVVSMHDLIQEMGKEIVREESIENPGKRSLLWDANDINEVWKNNMGTEAIQSIVLYESKMDEELFLNPDVFARMCKLKFLKLAINGYLRQTPWHLPQGLSYLPSELRLLHWGSYPLTYLPSTFCAKNLVELTMTNSLLEKLWDGVVPLVNLKNFDLSFSRYLLELPDLSMANNLENVYLRNCRNLRLVHPSVLSLHKLEMLDLSYCQKLTHLQSDVHLKSLCVLYLNGCSGLKEFSVTSENMEGLDLSNTAIEELPLSIGCLCKLEYFNLDGCRSLTHLPKNLIDLKSLGSLYICECIELRSLPELPPSLKQVFAQDCRSLETVQFTSMVADSVSRNLTQVRFENCMKLDEYSRNVIGLNARVILTNYAFLSREERESLMSCEVFPRVRYPGGKVPKWFEYRTSQTSITFVPHSELQGFILCVIIPPSSSSYQLVEVNCFLQKNDGRWCDIRKMREYAYNSSYEETELDSDHVCLLYKECYGAINEWVTEGPRLFQNINYKAKLSFEFSCEGEEDFVIKECGVCPIYTSAMEEEEDEEWGY